MKNHIFRFLARGTLAICKSTLAINSKDEISCKSTLAINLKEGSCFLFNKLSCCMDGLYPCFHLLCYNTNKMANIGLIFNTVVQFYQILPDHSTF